MTAPIATPIEVAGYWVLPKDKPDRLHCISCYREIWLVRKERTLRGFEKAAGEHRARWHF